MTVGEVEDVKRLYPDWHRQVIAPLEDAAAEAGIPRCVWGERTDSGRPGARGFRFRNGDGEQLAFDPDRTDVNESDLCSSCPIREPVA
jgi:hypothetical protein